MESERKLPFVCLGSKCPNTCCGPFHGTEGLRAALSVMDLGKPLVSSYQKAILDNANKIPIFAQIRLLPEDVLRLQSGGLDSLILRRGEPKSPNSYMRLKDDGGCIALDDHNLCSIHHYRPTLCRAFPFYVDLFVGLSLVSVCPGVGAGETSGENLDTEIRAAITMYKFWIEEIPKQIIVSYK